MEAKDHSGREHTAKGDGPDDVVTAAAAGDSKNIVLRFVEYAYKIINEDMDDFFEDNMAAFDQDDDDIASGRGETLEQYDVFKKYLEEVEVHFDQFSTVEGYASARDCLNDINSLVVKDETDRKKMMQDLQAKLRKAQAQWAKRCQLASGPVVEEADAKADSKTAEESKADSKAGRADGKGVAGDEKDSAAEEGVDDLEDEMELPVMMFFQPVSMDAMLNQVLSLTEYNTFSIIMRAKVKQKKLLRLMRKKVAVQSTSSRERRESLGFHEAAAPDSTVAVAPATQHADSTGSHRYLSERHVHVDVLLSEFDSLVDRICELTPNQKAIAAETRGVLKVSMWRQLVLGEADPEGPKGEDTDFDDRKIVFQKIVMNTAMCLWRVCSFEQQFVIRSHINVMMPKIAAIQKDTPDLDNVFHRAEALYLCMSHEIIDDIERQTLRALEDYETQHDLRRKAYRQSHGHK